MSKLEKSKEIYNNIRIPKELNEMVLSVIKESEKKNKEFENNIQNENTLLDKKENKSIILKKRKIIYKCGVGVAASFLLATVIGVNTSKTFAIMLQEIPIIRTFAKIVTIRSYEFEDEDKSISIEIPNIEFISDNTNELADEVNTEIFNMCNLYAKEALKRAEEYKESFIETGGTQEEWEKHNIRIKVGYEIKSQSENYLSFIVTGTESWTSAYAESKYYNLNLKNNQYLTLKDILGDDYIQKANKSIRNQITERKKAGDLFWDKEEGGFETITDKNKFYINESGNPIIVFDKYEIAPGFMGEVIFEIEK